LNQSLLIRCSKESLPRLLIGRRQVFTVVRQL
jgi:hypothetical protein